MNVNQILRERTKHDKWKARTHDLEEYIITKTTIFKCERCGKPIKDGDTYCLKTNRETEKQTRVCFNCGIRTSSYKYEILTLEA